MPRPPNAGRKINRFQFVAPEQAAATRRPRRGSRRACGAVSSLLSTKQLPHTSLRKAPFPSESRSGCLPGDMLFDLPCRHFDILPLVVAAMPRHGLGNRGFQWPIGPPAERRDRLAAVDLEVARFQNAAIFKLPPTGAGTPMESKRVRNLGHGRDRPFHRAEIPCPRNSSMVAQCAWRLFNPPKRPTAHLGPKPFRFGSPSASAERSQRKDCNAPVTIPNGVGFIAGPSLGFMRPG